MNERVVTREPKPEAKIRIPEGGGLGGEAETMKMEAVKKK